MDKLHVEVLRLFDGPDNSEDWHTIGSYYTSRDIEKIRDPASGTMKEITSIPSPFARIHLFEHAFKAVTEEAKANPADLNGNSMYHKLVSDCLDVGEVLFNYDVLQANPSYKLDVLTWSKQDHLDLLHKSKSERHRLMGETLELFLNQDKEGANFDNMQYIHLVECNFQIIGGTSPSTMFFAGYNDNYALSQLDLKQGDDVFFDSDLRPLHFRSMAYQRYLHGLFKVFGHLQQQMPIFYDYLDKSLKYLQASRDSKHKELMDMLQDDQYGRTQFFAEFEELSAGKASAILELLPGVSLRKKNNAEAIASGAASDFAIKSDFPDIHIDSKTPLVLVNGFRKGLNYFGAAWNPAYEVPYAPSQAPNERILPGQMVKYPYLTTSDFLEPYLIQMEYRIDKEYFFTGNPEKFYSGDRASSSPPDPSFLLPLKPLFFEYFKVETLKSKLADGKPVFRLRKDDQESVTVELRIPIQKENEYITLERTYRLSGQRPDESKNEGAIVEYRMNLGFLPLVKSNSDSIPFFQYVGLVDNDILEHTMSNQYRLQFLACGDRIPLTPLHDVTKSDKRRHSRNVSSRYYVLEQPYDVLLVDSGNARGVVVPNFQYIPHGDKQFSFAIDFGTTNTHIEYSEEGGKPVPFEINKGELQLVSLIERDSEWYYTGLVKDMFFHEFVPDIIGRTQTYSFPVRTVTTEIEDLNHSAGPVPIGDINISFIYEKWQILKNSRIETNLKWQNFDPRIGSQSLNRLRAFLSELLILIRNKVLISGGDMKRTKIVWFFPASMDEFQVQSFTKIWATLVKRYLNIDESPICFSEAIAPFYMHTDQRVTSQEYPVVSIDIGGGTTDIAIFEKDEPRIVTSAKFAGNVIWGDGFVEQPDRHNGIVRVFKPVVRQFLENNINNGLYNLAKTFEQIESDPRFSSADLMSFFFSIDRNKDVINKRLDFNFSDKLAGNQDFKIIFLVFYAAIIYYIARLMRIANFERPRFITLSGNGSRIFNLLDQDPRFRASARLAKFIFEQVYVSKYYQEGLDIIQHEEPKESTCKGGIRSLKRREVQNYDTMLWVGDKAREFVPWVAGEMQDGRSYTEKLGAIVNLNREKNFYPVQAMKYDMIDEQLKRMVIEEFKHFLSILEEGHTEMNFGSLFGINANRLSDHLSILSKDAASHLSIGIGKRLLITSGTENIAESLFFYPLVGGLYRLSNEIAEELGL